MAKDPAFLFYYSDFFTGVADLTNEEVGAYIRCLCMQAAKGGVSEKHMLIICNSHEVHTAIKSKFQLNTETRLFENLRLKEEMEKRKKYSESRSNNRKSKEKKEVTHDEHMLNISKTYVKHMENENINEDRNEILFKKGGVEEKTFLTAEAKNYLDGLCAQFGISEINNFKTFLELNNFVISLQHQNKISEAIEQSVAYFNFKKQNNERTHSPLKFIGLPINNYSDSVIWIEDWRLRKQSGTSKDGNKSELASLRDAITGKRF